MALSGVLFGSFLLGLGVTAHTQKLCMFNITEPIEGPSTTCWGCRSLRGPNTRLSCLGLQASCKTTIDAITLPTKSKWCIPESTSVPPPGCPSTSHTIRSGDTCQSIAIAQGFSTTQLIEASNLITYCRSFPKAGSIICMPDTLKCKPYPLRLGNIYNRIAATNKVSFAQAVSWNPEVGETCGNMEKLANKTMVICISAPGGAWVEPSQSQNSVSSIRVDTIFTMSGTGFVAMPSATGGSGGGLNIAPVANASRQDCQVYVTPPVLVNETAHLELRLRVEPVHQATGRKLSALAQNTTGITPNCSMTTLAETRMKIAATLQRQCLHWISRRGDADDVPALCAQLDPGHPSPVREWIDLLAVVAYVRQHVSTLSFLVSTYPAPAQPSFDRFGQYDRRHYYHSLIAFDDSKTPAKWQRGVPDYWALHLAVFDLLHKWTSADESLRSFEAVFSFLSALRDTCGLFLNGNTLAQLLTTVSGSVYGFESNVPVLVDIATAKRLLTGLVPAEGLDGEDAIAILLPLAAVPVSNPDRLEYSGWQYYPALHVAAERGDMEMAELLLECSARADVWYPGGISAAEVARGKGHEEVAERIERLGRVPKSCAAQNKRGRQESPSKKRRLDFLTFLYVGRFGGRLGS
ncbi:hypothetical protein B0T16DRAFT_394818 [Cercophora newfieldiana]|uniref:LysM domain-containing protein n=1 Tax=Cercophora newfieldiana TaxID=92897 RepID=A0AA39XRR4_9PEZI|nr:hypothetical protein B0T16DRAFT_394818 [Cercophora newfieldiana]